MRSFDRITLDTMTTLPATARKTTITLCIASPRNNPQVRAVFADTGFWVALMIIGIHCTRMRSLRPNDLKLLESLPVRW